MIKKPRKLLQERIDQDIQPKVIEKSVCESRRKCKSCQVTYTVNPKFPHKCLHMECKNCLKSVNISGHQCYITSDDERKLLLEERNAKNFGKCIQEVNKMETENGEPVQELNNGGIERTSQRVRKDLQRFRRERQELIEDLHNGVDQVETENRGREEQLEQQRMTAVEGLMLQGLEVEELTDDMITDEIKWNGSQNAAMFS